MYLESYKIFNCKVLVYSCFKYIPLGLVLKFLKLRKTYYVRLDVKYSATHCKGSQQSHIWCEHKNLKPQGFTI
jgi:hypothetical protein